MLDRRLGVPGARYRILELIQQRDLVIPAQLCKHPLHNLRLRPALGERSHVLQVAGRKPLHLRKRRTQVFGEAVDDLRSVALLPLLFQNRPTDLPIQENQLAVDSEHGAHLPRLDAAFQLAQPSAVVMLGESGRHSHGFLSRSVHQLDEARMPMMKLRPLIQAATAAAEADHRVAAEARGQVLAHQGEATSPPLEGIEPLTA